MSIFMGIWGNVVGKLVVVGVITGYVGFLGGAFTGFFFLGMHITGWPDYEDIDDGSSSILF